MVVVLLLILATQNIEQTVYEKCQPFVEKRLKELKRSHPYFPDFHDSTVTMTGDIMAIVECYVISEDSTGKRSKNNFRCILDIRETECKCFSVDIFDIDKPKKEK